MKHGYPLETSLGKPLEPKVSGEAVERIKLLTQENTHLRAELGSVKDRLETIERIVTTERFADFGTPCLVQAVVRGPTVSCSGVIAGEGMIAFATSRYARTFPPDGGPVAFAETVEPPAGLEQMIGALLTGMGWQGVFEVELVESDERLFTIDLNPRPFGSLELITKAGAPLAAIWCDWLLGHQARHVTARPGVRYRWEDADLRHFWWQLRRRRLRAALKVIRPRRRVAHAFFRLTDPGPFLARILYLLGRAFGRSDR